MTTREKFHKVFNFEKVDDRLPMIEWAPWWNKTIANWEQQGYPKGLSLEASFDYFGLDKIFNIGAGPIGEGCPRAKAHGAGIAPDEQTFDEIEKFLYPEKSTKDLINRAISLKEAHNRGDCIIRIWLDGFFWFPRTILGIQNHLYSFYEQPELIHRINDGLADFHLKTLKALFEVFDPDMIGIAEDMSYNHGSMLSYEMFKKFLLPYYQRIIPEIKKHGIKILIDSDGNIHEMIPWLIEAGIDGIYPLERQSNVDVNYIRENFPKFLMFGGYNKLVMSKGEAEMRAEFERLLPVMKSGGFLASVDHQTPPEVSLENYRIYLKLFREYSEKAAN